MGSGIKVLWCPQRLRTPDKTSPAIANGWASVTYEGSEEPGTTDFFDLHPLFLRPSQEQPLTMLKMSSLSLGFVFVHWDSFPEKEKIQVSFLPLGTFSSPNQKPNFTGPAEPESSLFWLICLLSPITTQSVLRTLPLALIPSNSLPICIPGGWHRTGQRKCPVNDWAHTSVCLHQHQNYSCLCLVQSLALLRGHLFPSPGVPGHVEGNVLV